MLSPRYAYRSTNIDDLGIIGLFWNSFFRHFFPGTKDYHDGTNAMLLDFEQLALHWYIMYMLTSELAVHVLNIGWYRS